MEKTKKTAIEDILKKNHEGLTLTEISNLLNISRNTASVALAELKGAEKIKIGRVGMAKLHYWKLK